MQFGCSDTEISVYFFCSRAYCIPVADCCFTDSSFAIAAACSLHPATTLTNYVLTASIISISIVKYKYSISKYISRV